MNPKIIFRKSNKGEEELRTRKFGISQNLRQVLIFVDGETAVSKILEKTAGLPHVDRSLEELERQGFIEADRTATVAAVKDELIAMARQMLGADAEKVVAKIADARETKQDLEAAIAGCKKLVRLTIDEKKAEELINKCSELLGRL
jgi:DNA-binding transcriptional regulator YhcF (GntR family)